MVRLQGAVAGVCMIGAMSLPGIGSARAAPARFTAFERAAFPALAGRAASDLPGQVQRFGTRGLGRVHGANPREARAVLAPDGSAHQMWYILPARGGMCLLRLGAAVCGPAKGALLGSLFLQAIQPYGNSPESPLPPQGAPVTSRIVGIAPRGTTGVTATTKSGQTIAGVVRRGMYAVSGADITSVVLTRDPLVVPVFSQ